MGKIPKTQSFSQSAGYGSPVIEFDTMQRLIVEVEALQVEGEQVGERLELESLVGVTLLAAVVTVVLVVAVQDLRLDEPSQSLLLREIWSGPVRKMGRARPAHR